MNIEKYNAYFNGGCDTAVISKLTVSDGNVIAADPFGLYADFPPYIQKIPAGEFDVTACVLRKESDTHIAAVNVRFTDSQPVRFEMALDGSESVEDVASLAEGEFFGFPVDSGLAAILDTTSLKAYLDFEKDWYKNNPDKNIYDDLLSDLFAESYADAPDFQRDCGDYIDFVIPGTDYHMPVFSSGFGDGVYPVYFGYSKDGGVCSMSILFIDV